MKAKLMGLIKDEEGQGMVEYGLIIGLVSIVAIAALTLMGPQISVLFTRVTTAITGAGVAP